MSQIVRANILGFILMASVPLIPTEADTMSVFLADQQQGATIVGYEPTSAELEDIAFVAGRDEISMDEAIARLAWQTAFAAYVTYLRNEYPSEFTGAQINDDGPRSVTLGFKGTIPAAVIDDPLLAGLKVEVKEKIGHTEKELVAQAQGIQEKMLDAGLISTSIATDFIGGTITVFTEGSATGQPNLPQETRASNVEVLVVEGARGRGETTAYGGARLEVVGGARFTVPRPSRSKVARPMDS